MFISSANLLHLMLFNFPALSSFLPVREDLYSTTNLADQYGNTEKMTGAVNLSNSVAEWSVSKSGFITVSRRKLLPPWSMHWITLTPSGDYESTVKPLQAPNNFQSTHTVTPTLSVPDLLGSKLKSTDMHVAEDITDFWMLLRFNLSISRQKFSSLHKLSRGHFLNKPGFSGSCVLCLISWGWYIQ